MPRRKKSSVMLRKDLQPGARVFIYARDSGGVASEKSVSDQVRELQAYAQAQGWVVVQCFTDEARKAADMEHRDAFTAMTKACRRAPRPVDAVVVWSFHRLFRDEVDAAYHKSDLRRHGVEFVSATQKVPENFAVLYEAVLDTVARIQIDQMAIDVRRGLRAHLVGGFAPPGTAPTGYIAERVQWGTKRDGSPRYARKWVEDPDKGPRVRRAFQMWAAGYGLREIHSETKLFASGNNSSYASMFRNRSYLGIAKFGEEEFPDHHPALVDQEIWEKGQTRMPLREDRPNGAAQPLRAQDESEFLLTGLVFCGNCGRALESGTDMRHVKTGKGNPWRYYRCRGQRLEEGACQHTERINARKLEQYVMNTVMDKILTPEMVHSWLSEMQARLASPEAPAQIEALDKEIVRLKRAIDRLLDMIETGDNSREVRERLRQRQAELGTAEMERDALAQHHLVTTIRLGDADLRRVLKTMRDELQAPEVPVARRALQSFVERVEVNGDEAEIVYRPGVILASSAGDKFMPPRGFEPLHQA